MASARETYQALNVGNLLWLDPTKVHVIGHDAEDEGHVLHDPRIPQHLKYLKSPDGRRFLESIKRCGVVDPVTVKREGDRVLLVRGRKRTLGCREANFELAREGKETVRLPAIVASGEVVDIAGLDNSYRTDESPLHKAIRAEGYRAKGYAEDDIGVLLDASRATLANWKILRQCEPAVLKAIEKEVISVTLGYELGKLPPAEQLQALDLGEQPDGEPKPAKEPTKRGRTRQVRDAARGEKAGKWTLQQVRSLHGQLAPDAEGFEDTSHELLFLFLEVVVGNDPTGKGMKDFPGMQRAVRKALTKAGKE